MSGCLTTSKPVHHKTKTVKCKDEPVITPAVRKVISKNLHTSDYEPER